MASRHPLQRLASPSRSVSFLIHLTGILSFYSSFQWIYNYPAAGPVSGVGGHYQFLTVLGLASALLCFVLGAFADLTLVPALYDAKNFVAVCATPLEVLISVLYWGISLLNRRLIVPEGMELPTLPDVGLHAAPAVFLAIDLLLLSPPWTIKAQGAMTLSMVLAFLYWGWVEYCFSYNGFYPYPLFELLSTGQRVLLFTTSAVLMTASTAMLKFVYGKINGIEKFQREALKPAKVD